MPRHILSPRRAAILLPLSAVLAACAVLSSGLETETPTSAPVAPTLAATELPRPTLVPTGEACCIPTPSPTPVPLTIAFVGRVSSGKPGSIVALSLQGAQVAASAHSAQLEVIDVDAVNPTAPAAAVRLAAEGGPAVVIVAGSELAEAARNVAADFPSVKFVGVDQPAVDSLANYFTLGDPGNRLDEEGFLAGTLAGLVTEAHTVGIVVMGGTLEGRLYANGFLHGVRYFCGDCEVRTIELNDPSDAAAGEGTATRLKNAGVDVMFAAAGAAGESGLGAATPLGVWVIGLGYDRVTASNGDPLVLGSVLRRPDLTLPIVVAALIAGQTPPHDPFALANGSISLSENVGPDVSPAMMKLIGDTISYLASGLLDTGVDLTTGEEK